MATAISLSRVAYASTLYFWILKLSSRTYDSSTPRRSLGEELLGIYHLEWYTMNSIALADWPIRSVYQT